MLHKHCLLKVDTERLGRLHCPGLTLLLANRQLRVNLWITWGSVA